ncbi:MAG: HEAT repeat domain-containing protein, partial [Planctomycetaceae bacterium]
LQALISLGEPNDVVRLIRLGLHDADSAVRAGVSRWLARQATGAPRPGTEDDWRAIQPAWDKLLGDDDPDVRFESARGLLALSTDHDAAREILLEFLRDPETQPAMQVSILKTLSHLGARLPAEAGPWRQLLQSDQAEVREEAAKAVGICVLASTSDLASPLFVLLNDEEPLVREEAARALGRSPVASAEILTALEAAVQDDDSLVAETAQSSLAALRSR